MSRLTMKRKYGEALSMTTKEGERIEVKINRIRDSIVLVALEFPATVEVFQGDRKIGGVGKLTIECHYGHFLTMTTKNRELIRVKIYRIRTSIVLVTLDLPASVEVVRDNAKKTERPKSTIKPSAA